MKKSRRTYNGVHLNKKSNTQDVVEQSLTEKHIICRCWSPLYVPPPYFESLAMLIILILHSPTVFYLYLLDVGLQ